MILTAMAYREAQGTAEIQLAFTIIGFVTLIPADLYFFAAQRASRLGQFTAFNFALALALATKDQAAALFCGLIL